ncbi:protein phosphatase 1 regulatory subunit 12C-like, partial [Penaeus japonicus]|uniref:protein phosphatase 1 regulatory subunit 12C-like n=1 Tax=Penaeus japonicus TaxID=27405 RepID=UPI001C711149
MPLLGPGNYHLSEMVGVVQCGQGRCSGAVTKGGGVAPAGARGVLQRPGPEGLHAPAPGGVGGAHRGGAGAAAIRASVANVNHQNKGGETALHCAAQYGHTEAAQLLLGQGGDPALPNLQAETPMDLASQYGRLSTVEVLVRAQPDLLRPYTAAAATAAVFPHTPLHRASRNGHREVVKFLLANGHHVNVRTGQGAPLHEAALCGKVDVVRVLLEAGADPEVRDDNGHTVLDTIALINTPVTQEITSLIKCHGQLITLDDDDADDAGGGGDDDGDSEGAGEPPSWPPPVWPPPSLPPIPTASELGSPYENVLIPTILHSEHPDGESRSSDNRASSRASDRESRTSDRESRTSDRESRTSDRESRISDRDGRTSVASRVSEATSDRSIYDVPPPPKTVGGGERASFSYRSQTSDPGDDDGVYEVPPPPRSCRTSSASLRASRDSRHLRPSGAASMDELQPPPSLTSPGGGGGGNTSSSSSTVTRRSTHTGATDSSSGSKVVEPVPPPKPPRRSMCPPSPTPDGDQDAPAYETIYFKSQEQSDYENVDVQHHTRALPPSTYAHTPARDSSDSEYDTPRPTQAQQQQQQHSQGHSNRVYGTISFKPVKSRRTSKSRDPHVYENTVHRYENLKERYETLRERGERRHGERDRGERERGERGERDAHPRDHHYHTIYRHHHHHHDNASWTDRDRDHHHNHRHRNDNLRDRNENLRDRNAQTLPRRPRASSAYAKIGGGGGGERGGGGGGGGGRGCSSGGDGGGGGGGRRMVDSSDDSDGDQRPKSLDFWDNKPQITPTPLSPTHYQQPPTPDHPPPSARQAQISISCKIQSVSRPPVSTP